MFKRIDYRTLDINPIVSIGEDWMLITAGNDKSYNTMTASWGHLGYLWGKPTSVIYIRPQRYTKQFADREDVYTLCFFPKEYRNALAYLGSHSGRDGDKVAAANLTPVHENGYTYFAEAELVFVCRKLYRAPILSEGFTDPSVDADCYPAKDYHDMYIGEIIETLLREG